MATTKAYLYCAKAKPYLTKVVELGKYDCVSKKDMKTIGYESERELKGASLNGTVCFKCECKEAFKIEFCGTSIKHPAYFFPSIHAKEVMKRSCLTEKQFSDYGKGKDLFALHFENVEAIEPMPITKLYKDEACTEPLTKAPQSWCYGYRKIFETVQLCHFDYDKEEFVNMKGDICHVSGDQERLYRIEKCMVLSIRSTWLCKIANGEKDLEVRKTCPKEIEKR